MSSKILKKIEFILFSIPLRSAKYITLIHSSWVCRLQVYSWFFSFFFHVAICDFINWLNFPNHCVLIFFMIVSAQYYFQFYLLFNCHLLDFPFFQLCWLLRSLSLNQEWAFLMLELVDNSHISIEISCFSRIYQTRKKKMIKLCDCFFFYFNSPLIYLYSKCWVS